MIPFRVHDDMSIDSRYGFENVASIQIVPFLHQYPDEQLRALSMYNPFCEMMGFGKQETRNRPTKVRGLVLLCSCAKPLNWMNIVGYSNGWQMQRMVMSLGGREKWQDRQRNGKALFLGNLSGCAAMQKHDEQSTYVNYQPGLFVWKFDWVKPIVPFDYKGQQGWKKFDRSRPADMEVLKRIQVVNYDLK